ncbi:uncharacterized protein [Littorina saxatilis]|uniref:Uncharacterized protein n=1 Tax=Littorina saxatilis TaxID=31220 RepID=A0AAN9B624_9CAEN
MQPFVFSLRHLAYQVALSVFFIGFELDLVGFCYLYWASYRVTLDGSPFMSGRYGLWEWCVTNVNKPRFEDCRPTPDTGWLGGVRGLQCLAVVSYSVAAVSILAQNWMFKPDSKFQRYRCFELFALIGSALVLGGFLLYLQNIEREIATVVANLNKMAIGEVQLVAVNYTDWCAVLYLAGTGVIMVATGVISFFSDYSQTSVV